MAGEHGGHRHGQNYGLPDSSKTTLQVPKGLIEECRQACFELFTQRMLERYGVATLEQLSPGDYYEALQWLSTKPKKRT